MKRHRITTMKLREISSVDRPAQVGAVSVLMKRRAEDPVVELIKTTFAEALAGNLLMDKVRETFYKAFEDLYEGKEAFRKALVEELAAGGDGTTASEAFKAWLGTLVDQATGAAKAVGAADTADLEKSFNEAADAWLAAQETEMLIKDRAGLTAAIAKALAAGAALTVGEVTAIHKAADDLGAADLLPVAGVLAKGGGYMASDAETERKKKKAALPADMAKHYDSLADDAARDAFLAKSAGEQRVELEKAAGDDPVLYTTLTGIDIRKSAGEVTLALAKENDDNRRELAKANARTEDAELTKRAGDDLGNIGGELVGKKALLKAVDGIADASTRDAALAVLKAANTAATALFKRNGTTAGAAALATTGADGTEVSEAEAQLDALAKAHATANNVTFEKAYATVIQTTEGSALYKRFVEGAE